MIGLGIGHLTLLAADRTLPDETRRDFPSLVVRQRVFWGHPAWQLSQTLGGKEVQNTNKEIR